MPTAALLIVKPEAKITIKTKREACSPFFLYICLNKSSLMKIKHLFIGLLLAATTPGIMAQPIKKQYFVSKAGT